MKIFKRGALFGRYPACDFINEALRLLIKQRDMDEVDVSMLNIAIDELINAILSSDGYFYDDIAQSLNITQIKGNIKP